MMLAYRLVHLIETHSDALAASLIRKVQQSECTPAYHNVPAQELKEQVAEIYHHLGEWLLGKTDLDIRGRYREIGECRAHQHVPFSQVAWAICLTRANLWEFLKRDADIERPSEIFGELELLQMLDQFFERAIYYAALGYEGAPALPDAQQPKTMLRRA